MSRYQCYFKRSTELSILKDFILKVVSSLNFIEKTKINTVVVMFFWISFSNFFYKRSIFGIFILQNIKVDLCTRKL